MTFPADLLNLFPPHTHPLSLVCDADGLLGGEAVLVELRRRGFTLLQESDPLMLRAQVEAARPFTEAYPLIIVTRGRLEWLPYDLWQPAYHITLSLHNTFPHLAYPLLRQLASDQLERLAACPPPVENLGRQRTMEYLLRHLFQAEPASLAQPAEWIAWLAAYHSAQSPMSPELQANLVDRLRRSPVYKDWDLKGILHNPAAFADFMQTQWDSYLFRQTERAISENQPAYLVRFEADERLQDLLPELLRKRILEPRESGAPGSMPNWARPGILQTDPQTNRVESLLAEFDHQAALNELDSPAGGKVQEMTWDAWKKIGTDWAALNAAWYTPGFHGSIGQQEAYRRFSQALDGSFLAWLRTHYSPLAVQKLPNPKQVYHIPELLAYRRSLGLLSKIALIILDGLSLADWQIIQRSWSKNRPDWRFEVDILLAQIPTITSISRCAMVSGLLPAEFAWDLAASPPERRSWISFWLRQGNPEANSEYRSISLDRDGSPPEVDSARIHNLCLVDITLDELTHGASLGAAGQQAALRTWLDHHNTRSSKQLEELIDQLLSREYAVFIASDHGHVEARGFGQPSEGLLAQTRGKRARLYQDRRIAQHIQTAFPETILWERDGLLPEDTAVLMPAGRSAFAPSGEVVVTHGGLTLEEMLVPYIQISRS